MNEIIQALVHLLARRTELAQDLERVDLELAYLRGRLAQAQAQAARDCEAQSPER